MIPGDLVSRFDTFGIAVARTMDGIEPSDLSNECLDDLLLKRKKCELCWTFLHHVQGLRKQPEGDRIASTLIDQWYNEIWMASTHPALEDIRLEIGHLPGFYPISS